MKARNIELWDDRPAETWTQAHPLGSGRLGATVYGGADRDRILLNEETVWGGHVRDANNPRAREALPEVRRRIFAGDLAGANELARETMLSVPQLFDSYQPLGDLVLESVKPQGYENYRRSLDLSEAVAQVSFETEETGRVTREYFVSAVDDVIVVRYEAERPGSLTFFVSLSRTENAEVSAHGADGLVLDGRLGEEGVSFAGVAKVAVDGGALRFNDWQRSEAPRRLRVVGADSVTIVVAARTDHWGDADFRARAIDAAERALATPYAQLRAAHVADHRALYDRFSLTLGAASASDELPTPRRVVLARKGEDLPSLLELYTNLCRYLLIASSRPGTLPSTLQGVWNEHIWAFCESDFHPNANMQINYWTAEGFALPETVEPIADWLDSNVASGEVTARSTYDSGGWTMNHCSDIFGYTSPNFDERGIWPMGGPWMVMHLWEHYRYSGDRAFLSERVYPLLRGSVRFLLDFLVEAPEGTAQAGRLVTAPSHSPENAFVAPDGTVSQICYGATMDTAIIRDVFSAALGALEVLREETPGLDVELEAEIRAAEERLLPYRISPTTGGIQEWAEDYEETEVGHRHVSHLYGLYPGTTIRTDRDPELAAAALHTILRKFEAGYDGQGWSFGWVATILARLGEGQRSYDALREIFVRGLVFPNLFIEAHTFPQVGDMQGVPAALLEMLAHSHADGVVLLPALPRELADGEVSGMRLRGGITLSMRWEGGRLRSAELTHPEGASPEIVVGTDGEHRIDRGATTTRVHVR